MAITRRKPRNSSLRFQTFLDSSDITTNTPEKSLVIGLKKGGGRNAYGRITVRHHGGGATRKYRMIDFKRTQKDVKGRVATVEYDPNRNVRIGLVIYENGAKAYMLLPEGVVVGHAVIASQGAEAKVGNSLPLRNIPVGFMVHNIEIAPGSGGKLARSAGFPQVERRVVQSELSRLDLGEIEDVVDHREQGFARVLDGHKVLALLGRQLALQDQFRHADDRVQRRADLVAHVGQEGALGAAGGFRGFFGKR